MKLKIADDLSLPVDVVTQTIAILAKPDAERIAWAAGLFEGEGSIRNCHQWRKDGRFNGTTRRLTLSSTDHDVIEQFRAVVRSGSVHRVTVKGNRKPCWRWTVDRWVDVNRIGRAFLPFLCARRAAAMKALLDNPPVKGLPEVCPQGHPLIGPEAQVYRRLGRERPICAVCKRAQVTRARGGR